MRGFFLIILFSSISPVNAQTEKLKSTRHGLEMMLTDVPKQQLIGELRFEDGKDDTIGVVRLDHVGPNLYPLIVSAKLAVATDSLGNLSFKLQRDTLDRFLFTIDNINPKFHDRKLDQVLIRVTYRYRKTLSQYYVTQPKLVCGFFRIIERRLTDNGDPIALERFYRFVAETGLRKGVNGRPAWVY